MIIATQPDTDVFVNGSMIPVNTEPVGPGEYLFLQGLYSSNNNMFVEATSPVLMFQTLGGSSNGATPGFNFIPPLGVGVDTSVDNIPRVELVGDASVGIIAEAGASVTINDVPPTGSARPVDGSPDWVTYVEEDLTGHVSVSSSGPIAVVLSNVSGLVGAAGYYSGFAREACDGVDNDMDGLVDEDFDVDQRCSVGTGECAGSGITICTEDGSGTMCDAVEGQPSMEVCDGLDNDCDDSTDEDLPALPTTCGVGECAFTGVATCVDGLIDDSCEPGAPGVEICDGLDNDCNGAIDDDLLCDGQDGEDDEIDEKDDQTHRANKPQSEGLINLQLENR